MRIEKFIWCWAASSNKETKLAKPSPCLKSCPIQDSKSEVGLSAWAAFVAALTAHSALYQQLLGQFPAELFGNCFNGSFFQMQVWARQTLWLFSVKSKLEAHPGALAESSFSQCPAQRTCSGTLPWVPRAQSGEWHKNVKKSSYTSC